MQIGVSKEDISTGRHQAIRKQFSIIHAEISPPMPPVKGLICKNNILNGSS